MKFNTQIIFLFTLFIILSGIYPQEKIPIPDLNRPVTDLVGILDDSEIQIIEKKILDLEKEKGSQIAILIIPTTGEESIEEYSMRVVEKWKLGRKGVDDGVLFLIAIRDRKMRIEVGYGLEGAIPDAKAKQILDDFVKPYFKQGNFYKGIDTGVDLLIKLIRNEPLPEPQNKVDAHMNFAFGLVFALFALGFHFIALFLNFVHSKTRGIIILILDLILISFLAFIIPIWLAIFLATFPIWFLTIIILIITRVKTVGSVSNTSSSSGGWSGWSSSSTWSSGSSGGFSGGGGSFGGGGSSSSW